MLFAFAMVWFLHWHGNLEYPEMRAYDTWLRSLPSDHSLSKNITIVTIDEAEARARKMEYPLRDRDLMRVINPIMALKPKALAIDMFRDQELGAAPSPSAKSGLKNLLREMEKTKQDAPGDPQVMERMFKTVRGFLDDLGPDGTDQFRSLLRANKNVKVV